MKRGWAWPLSVAGVLSLTIAANVWLIRVANNDPSFAVEEDYYQRGVHWDDELAQRARNTELGWRLTSSVSPIQVGRGADLRIALSDAVVAPIAGASVTVRAVHVGRARDPVDITLEPGAPGEYAALVPIERAGLWELRIDVHRGADRFTATKRLDVRFAEQ
jgi:nitrogen fixation protein FixH